MVHVGLIRLQHFNKLSSAIAEREKFITLNVALRSITTKKIIEYIVEMTKTNSKYLTICNNFDEQM